MSEGFWSRGEMLLLGGEFAGVKTVWLPVISGRGSGGRRVPSRQVSGVDHWASQGTKHQDQEGLSQHFYWLQEKGNKSK